MAKKSCLLTWLFAFSLAGVTSCGGDDDREIMKAVEVAGSVNSIEVGTQDESGKGRIQGNVTSEMTDVNLCQIYLYNADAKDFADMFDKDAASFVLPATPITATRPLVTQELDSIGNYTFEGIEVGQYQLVLNCLVNQDAQDETILKDDPIQYDGFTIPASGYITPNIKKVDVFNNSTTIANFVDENKKPVIDRNSDVVVELDTTDEAKQLGVLHNLWGTVNRIAPKAGVEAIKGLKVNTVRMLGGINKKDRNGNNVPDLDYDIATYNTETQSYDYNFKPLTDRIDAILAQGTTLYQLVLDQPPWAFQTGYTFIPDSQKDGINFRWKERVSHYGNSLPPKDKVAYNAFLRAVMQHLVDTYGVDLVKSWRFRIGSEIETPDHWFGTEQDFIEHFANSVSAIRAVIPDAVVGLHTRAPNFIYKNGTVTNYKNEKIKSFANGLIDYCYDNDIKYDFWGVSDYPFINQAASRDPKTKYAELFQALVTHPKWQAGTIIDIEEFTVITKMGGVPNAAYISSDSPQADTFSIALTDEFYRHGVDQVFQWGLRSGAKPWRLEILESMYGKQRIEAEIKNPQGGPVDNIGAIVVAGTIDHSIEAITYNYDPEDLEADHERNVQLYINTVASAGSTFYFRKKLTAKQHHPFYSFMRNSSAPSWLVSGNGYDRYGTPDLVLNANGKAEWERYVHPNPPVWTEWQAGVTLAREDRQAGSVLIIDSVLPLFSFEKTEIKWADHQPDS
ncbi:MAG: hypothetical protein GYB33_00505 [Gammaproteobacteria bacterium]|nr:hypothetical protein [Gammaproteobacteria bacterium]